jgi:ABC-2 type transport system permease protein
MGLFKWLTRVSAFVAKDLTEVGRRPGAFVSLVLGPFVLMALFGIGFSGVLRPLETIIVVPAGDTGMPRDTKSYQDLAGPEIHVRQVTQDEQGAVAQLRDRKVDLVVVAPENAPQKFAAGQQSTLTVDYNELDPYRANNAYFLAQRLSDDLNREIVRRAARSGVTYHSSSGPVTIPPDVLAQPTVGQSKDVAPTAPGQVQFFAPAVLALVVQHMAVTLVALSLMRERISGSLEVYRTSPATTLDIFLGKYIALGILAAMATAIVTTLTVVGLGVPFLGRGVEFAGIIAALTFASLSIGMFFAVIADSERQVVQLSLLMLLGSVFFSGFVLSTSELVTPVRIASFVLPVTAANELLRDSMLRGASPDPVLLAVLAGLGIGFMILAGLLFGRSAERA